METTEAVPAAPAPAPAVFDLASRYMAETIDVPIPDPVTKEPTGMVWTIASQFSKEARTASLNNTRLKINDKGEVEVDTNNELSDSVLEQIIAATRGWKNFTVNGEPLPCTPENARTLLTEERTAWIRPPVQIAFLSLSRFFDSAKPN